MNNTLHEVIVRMLVGSGPRSTGEVGGLGGRARAMTYHTVAVLSRYSADTWLLGTSS